nr:MAG TPA: hypothetical protein [Caudoviricetes sp.]
MMTVPARRCSHPIIHMMGFLQCGCWHCCFTIMGYLLGNCRGFLAHGSFSLPKILYLPNNRGN